MVSKTERAMKNALGSSMNSALILVNFDFLCRCALSDEGASRLTDVHDNSEEVISYLLLSFSVDIPVKIVRLHKAN